MSIGAQIKALRTQRGWTQQELASISGLSQSAISYIELGDIKEPRDAENILRLLQEWMPENTLYKNIKGRCGNPICRIYAELQETPAGFFCRECEITLGFN